MNPASFRQLLGCSLLGLPLVLSGADVPAATEAVLELPKYTVTNQLKLPKPESWHYARIPGFEVLSSASPSVTQHFLRDFQQLQQVIDIVWPALRQASPTVPGTLVIYAGGRAPDLLEATMTAVGDEIIEFEPAGLEAGRLGAGSAFFANDEAAFLVVDLNRPEPTEQFYRAYLRHLFSRTNAAMAPWLREGMARLLASVDFSTKWIKFGWLDPDKVDGFKTRLGRTPPRPPAESWDKLDKLANSPGDLTPEGSSFSSPGAVMGKFPPLADMLAADESAIGKNHLSYLTHAFVHMCLYGRGQRFQKPFLTYIARTDGGKGSEEIFRDCFGMKIQAMQAEIESYVEMTNYNTITYRAEKGRSVIETPPAVELRTATQAEVGRIKGDGLVLAGRKDIARVAFLAPYIRGEHDADLLASLGLYEMESGKVERVRNLLELAARGGTKRARAYLELARLRAAARPAAGDHRPAAPPEALLEPLRHAAALEPPQIEVYEFLAKEWLRCSAPPPPGDLALLEGGAVRFQRKLKLVYDTARLFAAAGSTQKAARLAGWGAQNAIAPADRERFAQLLASVQPAPAVAR